VTPGGKVKGGETFGLENKDLEKIEAAGRALKKGKRPSLDKPVGGESNPSFRGQVERGKEKGEAEDRNEEIGQGKKQTGETINRPELGKS